MKRRLSYGSAIRYIIIIVGVIIGVVIIGNVISFMSIRDRLPQQTYMADIDISALTVDEAISRTELALQTPVALRYQTSIIQLAPDAVEFKVNDVVARLLLDKIVSEHAGLNDLVDFMLRHIQETRIAAPYQYSEEKLDGFLSNIAHDYNRDPKPPQPDIAKLTLTAGQDGLAMSLDEAHDPVLKALASGVGRFVDLPVDVVPLGQVTLQSLGELVKTRLSNFTNAGNVAGIFIKDLGTGQELSMNGDVAFSGPGWLKLAVLVEDYRSIGGPANAQDTTNLVSIVTEGSTLNTNEVLRAVGQGDPQAGANQINATLKKMGLVSTFLAQPFDQPTKPSVIVTPGNSHTDVNTTPDANAQSTPIDIGLLFEMLDQCRNGTGALPLAFPGQFTAAKCKQMLDLFAQNKINALLAVNSAGATVIHRQSWDANNHGDAALVYTPGGNYILAVMLHGSSPLNWADTSSIMSDIARAAYGFFNKGQVPPPAGDITTAPPP